MSIVAIGVNHRTAPLAVLERLALASVDVPKAVAGLAQRDTIREVAVLATCGRTEVYAVAERFHGAYADLTDFLTALSGMGRDELSPHLLALHDDAAVTHLMEVAAGLDSPLLGESEILGQVRSAGQVARRSGGAGTTLDLLFRHAVQAGRRARSETAIGRGTASISQAAVEIAAGRLGTLHGRRALVVGAGEMGAGVTAALRKAGVVELTVANRSAGRGRSVAGSSAASAAVGIEAIPAALARCDLAITCAAGGDTLITAEALAGRDPADALLVVDIALPRNVDGAVGRLPGVTVLDLTDVGAWAERGRAARAAEVGSVRAVVAEQLERFAVELTARQAAPLVAKLHDRAEDIRDGEVRRYATRLGALDDDQLEAVDALTRAIIAKLLHHPSVRLRNDAGTPRGERNAAAVSDLFDLDAR